MSDVLRFGVIGCGGNGRRQHIKRLLPNPEAEIAALADPSEKMLALAREECPELAEVPAFADHREMLAGVELDAVVISTPHTLHRDQILDCLDAGLDVLAEKPLTTSVADTHAVIEKSKAAGKVVCVAFQRRWHAMQRYMRAFVRDEAFGTPTYVQSFVSQAWLTGTAGTWRQQLSLSGGGQLNDTGAHLVDMIFWVMPAPPVEVTALIDNRGTEVDIDSAVAYRFADGCLGSLAILGSGPRGVFWEDMTIAGTGGRALFYRKDELSVVIDGKTSPAEDLGTDGDPDSHFIDVVKGRAENASPPEDFLPVIAFSEACWKSADAGGKSVAINY